MMPPTFMYNKLVFHADSKYSVSKVELSLRWKIDFVVLWPKYIWEYILVNLSAIVQHCPSKK